MGIFFWKNQVVNNIVFDCTLFHAIHSRRNDNVFRSKFEKLNTNSEF